MAVIGFVLARHTDHARAAPACDLRRSLPDLAVDAHHQHGLGLGRHSGAAQAFHGRDKGNADAGGFIPGETSRLLHHRIGFDGKMRGVGAVAPDPEVAR